MSTNDRSAMCQGPRMQRWFSAGVFVSESQAPEDQQTRKFTRLYNFFFLFPYPTSILITSQEFQSLCCADLTTRSKGHVKIIIITGSAMSMRRSVQIYAMPLSTVTCFCTKLGELIWWRWKVYHFFHLDMKEEAYCVCCFRQPPCDQEEGQPKDTASPWTRMKPRESQRNASTFDGLP